MKIPVIERYDHHCSLYALVQAENTVWALIMQLPGGVEASVGYQPLLSQLQAGIRIALWYEDSYAVRAICREWCMGWEKGIAEYREDHAHAQ